MSRALALCGRDAPGSGASAAPGPSTGERDSETLTRALAVLLVPGLRPASGSLNRQGLKAEGEMKGRAKTQGV